MPIISQLNARATKKHPKSPNLLFMTIQFSKYVEGLSCDRHCDKHWKYKYSKTHAHVFKKITFNIFRNVSEFELTFKNIRVTMVPWRGEINLLLLVSLPHLSKSLGPKLH